jgi:hypothetical protein
MCAAVLPSATLVANPPALLVLLAMLLPLLRSVPRGDNLGNWKACQTLKPLWGEVGSDALGTAMVVEVGLRACMGNERAVRLEGWVEQRNGLEEQKRLGKRSGRLTEGLGPWMMYSQED